MPDEIYASAATLHYYEEPYLSGTKGSGTIFFTGCSLKCVYCQNYEISEIIKKDWNAPEKNNEMTYPGKKISAGRLVEIFFEQKERGAQNINLVTGTHYTPTIALAIKMAKDEGFDLPIIWNSSGYEKVETLKLLSGLVDVWLPDFKTMRPEVGQKYYKAKDYPQVAKDAINFMVKESGGAVFEEGMMVKGVNVRHLVIPGNTKDSIEVIDYLYDTYGDGIWISIMSQYTPLRELEYEELNRRLTKREYEKVVNYAINKGIKNAMIQEEGCVGESFIPKFDGRGI